jgi:hypothetical protein
MSHLCIAKAPVQTATFLHARFAHEDENKHQPPDDQTNEAGSSPHQCVLFARQGSTNTDQSRYPG